MVTAQKIALWMFMLSMFLGVNSAFACPSQRCLLCSTLLVETGRTGVDPILQMPGKILYCPRCEEEVIVIEGETSQTEPTEEAE